MEAVALWATKAKQGAERSYNAHWSWEGLQSPVLILCRVTATNSDNVVFSDFVGMSILSFAIQ